MTEDRGNPFAQISLVVFDLDGTLVDAFEDIAKAANHVLAGYGRPPMSVDQVKKHVGKGARVLVAGVLGTDDQAEIDRAYEVLVHYYQHQSVSAARLYDGALETLGELRLKGYKLGVVSNKPDPLTRKTLEELGAMPLLDWCRGEMAGTRRKPFPDALETIMGEAGVGPAQTVVVGDSHVDVEFARAAGAHVVGVSYGQFTAEEMRGFGPDAVIGSLRDLPGLLAGGAT